MNLDSIPYTTTANISSSTDFIFSSFPDYSLGPISWSLLFGFCFILGIAVGANNVAFAFGTSVGSGIVTENQAFILATIIELAAYVASEIGDSKTSDLQVVEYSKYYDKPEELIMGHIAMLIGCATWLIIATFYSMPVSSNHALLGGTIGFSIVLRGFGGIIWKRIGVIAAAWILSPIASAIATLVIFFFIDVFILRRPNPVKSGLFYLPVIYVIVVFVHVILMMQDGRQVLRLTDIPVGYALAISLIIAVIAGFVALFVVGPIMEKRLEKEEKLPKKIARTVSYTNAIEPTGRLRRAWNWAFPPMRYDNKKAVRLFSLLQLVTACFAKFAHGAGEISDTLDPLNNLITLYNQAYGNGTTHKKLNVYIGLVSTLAVILGTWIVGKRVVETVGKGVTELNPATGFSMEFGAAFVAVAINAYNIPASMVHCLFGSMLALGMVRAGPILKWNMIRKVLLSWLLTIPMSGLIAAAAMYVLQAILQEAHVF